MEQPKVASDRPCELALRVSGASNASAEKPKAKSDRRSIASEQRRHRE